jgi:hypothetical protein
MAFTSAPCVLHVYGAYGENLDLGFDATRYALIDRGWVFAWAHVRGGGELGHTWCVPVHVGLPLFDVSTLCALLLCTLFSHQTVCTTLHI